MKGKLLVLAQFILIFLIIYYGQLNINGVVSLTFLFIGLLIGFLAIINMRFSVNVFPEVRKSQQLVTSGIYKYIRHPMYSAVLLTTASFVVGKFSWLVALLWLILLAVLVVKLSYEEEILVKNFKQYSKYKHATKRLIPFII